MILIVLFIHFETWIVDLTMTLMFKQKFNYNHLGIQLKYLHIKLMKEKLGTL